MAVRVLLVDDDELFLESLTRSISDPRISVVGTARTGEEALAQMEELEPDVVVVDALMPGIGGIETARLCRQRHPDCRLVLMSGSIFQDREPDHRSLPVDRYLTKREVMAEIEPTVLAVYNAPTDAGRP